MHGTVLAIVGVGLWDCFFDHIYRETVDVLRKKFFRWHRAFRSFVCHIDQDCDGLGKGATCPFKANAGAMNAWKVNNLCMQFGACVLYGLYRFVVHFLSLIGSGRGAIARRAGMLTPTSEFQHSEIEQTR
ncbi:hypothetical protein DBR47_07420 [Paucibacter sp. KBW04]|nr:hypothetical protein DBR47_07420 [Paucibacter sp. KBW04]